MVYRDSDEGMTRKYPPSSDSRKARNENQSGYCFFSPSKTVTLERSDMRLLLTGKREDGLYVLPIPPART